MKIKELRQITGLSQKKFSEKFKIPVRTIQNWESGTNPTPVYTERLIEMELILENEIEALRAGQLRFNSSEPEPEPQQQQKPQEEINTDTVQEPKTDKKILAYMKASLMNIELEDIYCDNCKYGKACHYKYIECEKYRETDCDECKDIKNWIYWDDLERMIENGTN